MVVRNLANWRIHRALFALNNAQVYGRLKYLFSSDTMRFFSKRIRAVARYTDLTRARVRYHDSYIPKYRESVAGRALGSMNRPGKD